MVSDTSQICVISTAPQNLNSYTSATNDENITNDDPTESVYRTAYWASCVATENERKEFFNETTTFGLLTSGLERNLVMQVEDFAQKVEGLLPVIDLFREIPDGVDYLSFCEDQISDGEKYFCSQPHLLSQILKLDWQLNIITSSC